MNVNSPIGIFDSGMGGISVLKQIHALIPQENLLYFGDSAYAPYGEKSRAEITERCYSICEFFMRKKVKAIVIACNTATSACVNELRKRYLNIPIIGMEPALKVAADNEQQQHILVLATYFTLKEKKFADLMARCEKEHIIYKQPCPALVHIVEEHKLQDEELVKQTLRNYLAPYNLEEINSIVLGCTHFVFYRKYLTELLPKHIAIIDGNTGTAKQVKHLLEERDLLKQTKDIGAIEIYNSLEDDKDIQDLAQELLKG